MRGFSRLKIYFWRDCRTPSRERQVVRGQGVTCPPTTRIGSIADDRLDEQAVVEEVLAVGQRPLVGDADVEVLAQDELKAGGRRDEVVAGDVAGADVDQAVPLADGRGQAAP